MILFGGFVNAVLKSEVNAIKFPSTVQEMGAKALLFSSQAHYHPALYGCIGALDGLAIRIRLPSKKAVDNQIAFINR